MTFNDEYMRLALEQALYAMSSQEVPVGAIIVNRKSGEIVGRGYNQMEAASNPTYHAELLAINDACKNTRSKNLCDCDIYVTLEPCTMCAAAISNARIGRVFYGANDPKMGAVEHGVRFFTSHTCHHRPEVYVGIMALESQELMKQFFNRLR
jgi:tRNA(adenine34) deaminase